jgi:DNA-binding response OmpR family regulator
VGQRPFVLIVEDDAKLRNVIATNLSARGYLVFEASTFSQAVDRLTVKPQVMVLDIRLPDATGWDLADWAKSEAISVPTIVISGAQPDQQQMKRFKPMSFLRKPFDIRQLMELVEMYAPAS